MNWKNIRMKYEKKNNAHNRNKTGQQYNYCVYTVEIRSCEPIDHARWTKIERNDFQFRNARDDGSTNICSRTITLLFIVWAAVRVPAICEQWWFELFFSFRGMATESVTDGGCGKQTHITRCVRCSVCLAVCVLFPHSGIFFFYSCSVYLDVASARPANWYTSDTLDKIE